MLLVVLTASRVSQEQSCLSLVEDDQNPKHALSRILNDGASQKHRRIVQWAAADAECEAALTRVPSALSGRGLKHFFQRSNFGENT